MRKLLFYATGFSLIFAASCKNDSMNTTRVKTPTAEKIPTEIETHGDINRQLFLDAFV